MCFFVTILVETEVVIATCINFRLFNYIFKKQNQMGKSVLHYRPPKRINTDNMMHRLHYKAYILL